MQWRLESDQLLCQEDGQCDTFDRCIHIGVIEDNKWGLNEEVRER